MRGKRENFFSREKKFSLSPRAPLTLSRKAENFFIYFYLPLSETEAFFNVLHETPLVKCRGDFHNSLSAEMPSRFCFLPLVTCSEPAKQVLYRREKDHPPLLGILRILRILGIL